MLKKSHLFRWCTVIALVAILHVGIGYLLILSKTEGLPRKKNILVVNTIKLSPQPTVTSPPILAESEIAPIEKVTEPKLLSQPSEPHPNLTQLPKPEVLKKAQVPSASSPQQKEQPAPSPPPKPTTPKKTPQKIPPQKKETGPPPKEKTPTSSKEMTATSQPKKMPECQPVEKQIKKDIAKPQSPKLPPKKPIPDKSAPAPSPSSINQRPTPEELIAIKVKEEEQKRKQTLISQAQSKLTQLKNTVSSSPTKPSEKVDLPSLGTLATEATLDDSIPQTKSERDYITELIKRLKLSLKLPEYGCVKIKLTLRRSGEISTYKIESGSKKNTDYIDSKLPQLSFPAFGQFLPDEATHTFSLSLSNEI